MIRISSRTYYGYSGRLKYNVGKTKKAVGKKTEKKEHYEVVNDNVVIEKVYYQLSDEMYECSCTEEMYLHDDVFPEHNDLAGNYCTGSGENAYFWRV